MRPVCQWGQAVALDPRVQSRDRTVADSNQFVVRSVTIGTHLGGAGPLWTAPPTWGELRGSDGLVAQKPPTPLGVPRPVGPSHPVLAAHHCVVGQEPLLPEVTSKSEPGCA
jgi:hypothetical protein